MGIYGWNRSGVRGFTLVEVMITMAIIGVMSVVSLGTISGSRGNKDIEANARILMTTIREAQNYALTGKNIRGMCGAKPCVPYSFKVSASGSAYVLEQSSIDAPAVFAGTASTLLNAVTVNSTNGGVVFTVPRGEPSKGTGGAELVGSDVVDFSVSKDGKTSHVCVYPLGRVEEKPIGVAC